ncbi:MAG: hypothetical protein IPH44_34605 [Myxococcales bacterium]|nr:hypothetical protein [Myxococcales bacterium]MBK7192544.1 hypothetical protein [Myxococcales bacterium]
MKLTLRFVACLSLALGACATTKPAAPSQPTRGATVADGIRFPQRAPKVGDTVTETEEMRMVATVEVSPTRRVQVLSNERRIEEKEVVALDGAIVAKLKVSYPTVTTQEIVDGQPRAKPTPTVGKTYLVWREGGELKVSYADGTAPSPAEIEEVRKGNRSVGRSEPLVKIIAGRVWKVGEAFALTAEQRAEVEQSIGRGGDGSLTSMVLTLQTVDPAVATMAMTMAMAMKGADGEMTFEIAGTVKLDRRTGRPLELGGTGPFSGIAQLKMVGTMTMKTRYAY